MSQLPPELYERILAELEYDTNVLKQLSLTSSNLTSICQRHLLRKVTIGKITTYDQRRNAFALSPEIIPGSPSHFAHLLVESPHVANHVRALVILESRASPWSSQPRWPGLALDSHLQAILPLLRSLNTLKVASDIPSEPSWQSLPVPFLKALVETLRLPSLTTVDLCNAPIFSLLRGAGNNIRNLIIHPSIDDGNININFLVDSQQTIILESLVLEDRCDIADVAAKFKGDISYNVLLTNLKRLDIGASFGLQMHASVPKILVQCALTLEVFVFRPCPRVFMSAHRLAIQAQSNPFVIDIAREMMEFTESIDIGSLKALKRLQLKDLFIQESRYTDMAHYNCMPWLTALFQRGPKTNRRLEEIELNIEYRFSEQGDLAPTPDKFIEEWKQVVNVLLNGQYPKLKSLKIDLLPHGFGMVDWFMSGVAESLRSQGIKVHVQEG